MAVTDAPVVALNPAAGDQLYVAAPPAVRTTEPPLQKAAGALGLTVTVGFGLTVIVTSAVEAVQGELAIVHRTTIGPAPPVWVKVAVTVAPAVALADMRIVRPSGSMEATVVPPGIPPPEIAMPG